MLYMPPHEVPTAAHCEQVIYYTRVLYLQTAYISQGSAYDRLNYRPAATVSDPPNVHSLVASFVRTHPKNRR